MNISSLMPWNFWYLFWSILHRDLSHSSVGWKLIAFIGVLKSIRTEIGFKAFYSELYKYKVT